MELLDKLVTMFGNRRYRKHSKLIPKQLPFENKQSRHAELKCATEPNMEFFAEYNFFVLLLFPPHYLKLIVVACPHAC